MRREGRIKLGRKGCTRLLMEGRQGCALLSGLCSVAWQLQFNSKQVLPASGQTMDTPDQESTKYLQHQEKQALCRGCLGCPRSCLTATLVAQCLLSGALNPATVPLCVLFSSTEDQDREGSQSLGLKAPSPLLLLNPLQPAPLLALMRTAHAESNAAKVPTQKTSTHQPN